MDERAMQMCAALPAKKLEPLVAHLLLWQVGVIEVRGPAVSGLALCPRVKASQLATGLYLGTVTGLLALVYDPHIAEPYVLAVFLQFEALCGWADTDTTIGMLDRDIVVNFDSIPPHGCASGFNRFVTVPLCRFEDEVKRLPLAVGSPRVYIRHTLHAECSNAVGTDLPVVRIIDILAFGRLDLEFVSVL